ncbi:MAG TPA: LysR family transcriptional regulator [Paenirhodobacter sp.]
MQRDELGDLLAFLTVYEERSFTRAAARMGTSQSALSHTVKRLEQRLALRLLTRTTRNISPTEAGDRLAETLRPAFSQIETRLDSLNALREKPAGTLRITSSRHVTQEILFPKARELMAEYPDIHIEISVDQKLTDIVEERFDAGVRLGESIEKDMIAVRIGPDMRMLVAGSPDYFARHGRPQMPHDLTAHLCLNLRLPTLGGLYTWEFGKDGRPLNVRVGGQFVTNDVELIVQAALDGMGLCCLPDQHLLPWLRSGALLPVLQDWSPPFSGYHLYYPSRLQASPAFRLLLNKLRWHGDARPMESYVFGADTDGGATAPT